MHVGGYVALKAFAGSLFVMPSYKEPIVMAGSVLANINPNAPEIYIGDAISYISSLRLLSFVTDFPDLPDSFPDIRLPFFFLFLLLFL